MTKLSGVAARDELSTLFLSLRPTENRRGFILPNETSLSPELMWSVKRVSSGKSTPVSSSATSLSNSGIISSSSALLTVLEVESYA